MTDREPARLPEDQLIATFCGATELGGLNSMLVQDGATLLIGPGDSGKAALMLASGATFGERFFFHHAGLGGESGKPDLFLWRLMTWIRRTSGFPDPVPTDAEVQREALPNWLARAAAGGDFCIAIADGQSLTKNGLEPDLEWLPQWLPPGVKIIVSVKPGPDAELWRERINHAVDHQAEGAAKDLRKLGRETLREPTARRVAELLWSSRNGLSLDDLNALCEQPAEPAIEKLEPFVARRNDHFILTSATARELAVSGALADHGARQKMHLLLADHFAEQPGKSSHLLQIWHNAQAGHSERVLAGLLKPSWLAAAQDPGVRFESIALWKRLGDTQFMVDRLAEAFHKNEFQAEVLMGVISLVESASGQAVPRDWLQAGLTAALGNSKLDVQAAIFERLGTHPESADEDRLKLLLQALSIRESSLGAGQVLTESVRHNVACRHEELGDLPSAAENYRAGIRAIEQLQGPAAGRLIPWLNNLAAVHKASGELKAAAELTSRALKLARGQLGARHPTTAGICDQLAGIHYQAGNYAEAEPLFREALNITQETFGPEHPASAACMNNLATLLDARQEFKEAETLYRRALTIRQSLHGEHHSDTASSLHNLATVLESAGKADEAEQLFRRALDAWDKVSGQESPAFATTLLSLADLLRDRERWGDAEALYRSDIEIWRSLVGPEHPHTLSALSGLARLYVDGGKPELGEPLLMHVIESAERVVGKTDPLYMEAVGLLGALLRKANRLEEARQLIHDALAAHDNTLAMISAPVQKLHRLLDSLDSPSTKLH